MKLAIMQPYFFPYIGYFQLINAVDLFVIYDDVNYITRGWINRNNILVNNKAHLITVPLKDASQNKIIKSISRTDNSKDINKIVKTIESSYSKAPYFQNVFPFVFNSIISGSLSVSEYNTQSLKTVCAYLEIKTAFIDSSSVYENSALKGPDRIIDICVKEKADHYLNPAGGVHLYSNEAFNEKIIKLNFLKSLPTLYKQFANDFIPWLSIIDVLMFNPPEEIKKMLDQYVLA